MSWNSEAVGGVARGEPQPDSLPAADGIYYHIGEALILDLHHRGFSRRRVGVLGVPGTCRRRHKKKDEATSDERSHGKFQ